MENRDWRKSLSDNLTALRRKQKLTQTELGEKLNYSDKSVSKWERGEGVPDLSVMVQLSELYGVGVDEMLGRVKKAEPEAQASLPPVRHAAVIITSCAIVLLTALAVFVTLTLAAPELTGKWLSFLAALPVMTVTVGVMFLIWKDYGWTFGALSIALWTGCLFVQQLAPKLHAGLIYSVGGILQLTALAVCGFIILHKSK